MMNDPITRAKYALQSEQWTSPPLPPSDKSTERDVQPYLAESAVTANLVPMETMIEGAAWPLDQGYSMGEQPENELTFGDVSVDTAADLNILIEEPVNTWRETSFATEMEPQVAGPRHMDWLLGAIFEARNQLAALEQAVANDPANPEQFVEHASGIITNLYEHIAFDEPAGPLALDMAGVYTLLAAPGLILLQSTQPPPLPPDTVREILREFARILGEAVKTLAREGRLKGAELAAARRFLANLNLRISQTSRIAAGFGVSRVDLQKFLWEWFANFMRQVGARINTAMMRRIGTQIVRMLGRFFLGGFAIFIVKVSVAFAAGYVVGRVIGNMKVGRMTIDEHILDMQVLLTEGEYCGKAYELFLTEWKGRRDAQASGASDERILFFLEGEIKYLKDIIESGCTANPGRWSKMRSQRMRLRDALRGQSTQTP